MGNADIICGSVIMSIDEKDIQRFKSKVNTAGKCHLWYGGVHPSGYGVFYIKGAPIRAHQFAWLVANYPQKIPKDMCIMHLCDNPLCVNPAHLHLGTHKDNMQDKCNKKRQSFGEHNGRAKLTEQDVRAIYKQHTDKQTIASIGFQTAFPVSLCSASGFLHHRFCHPVRY
jgi:hypothetical protein